MPGPANKHMNARAFSRAHGREISAAHTTLCPHTRARASELSGGTQSQTVPEHCLVLLTANGTIYLGCVLAGSLFDPHRGRNGRENTSTPRDNAS